jgi:hypothetical protein
VAQVRADLVQALLAVVRFGILPGLAGPVEKGLRHAVQHRGSGPLTAVGGQARQAEGGVGKAGPFTVAAAYPQGGYEAGPRGVRVAVMTQHPAQVDQHMSVLFPDGPLRQEGRVQVLARGREIAGPQRVHAGVVVQDAGEELIAGSLGAGDGLGEQRLSPRWVDKIQAQQVPRHAHGENDIVTQGPGSFDSLGRGRKSLLRLAGEVARAAHRRQGVDEQPAGVQLAGQLDRLGGQPPGGGHVDVATGQGHEEQRPAEQLRIGAGLGPIQDRPEQGESFLRARTRHPVALKRDAEAQDLRRPGREGDRVPGGAPQVRAIGVQPGEPGPLVGPGQVRGGRLGDGQEVPAVGRGDGRLVAGLGEAFGAELADSLQQPVTQSSPGGLGHHQALVHQGAEKIGDVEHLDVDRAADRFGGVQVEAIGEGRQAAEQRLLRAVQQRVGPLDGGPQGLLPGQGGAAAAGEQPEPLVQTVVHPGQRQRPQPGRGELDGQRQPVQPPADRHDQRDRLGIDGQASTLCSRSVDEQHDRVAGLRSRRAGSGERQRRHPVDGLAADAERLAAGDQQMHPRAAPRDGIGGLSAGADQVLAVVQHDQDVLRHQGIDQGLQHRPARFSGNSQRIGNG